VAESVPQLLMEADVAGLGSETLVGALVDAIERKDALVFVDIGECSEIYGFSPRSLSDFRAKPNFYCGDAAGYAPWRHFLAFLW
jgi:hypothetical protein